MLVPHNHPKEPVRRQGSVKTRNIVEPDELLDTTTCLSVVKAINHQVGTRQQLPDIVVLEFVRNNGKLDSPKELHGLLQRQHLVLLEARLAVELSQDVLPLHRIEIHHLQVGIIPEELNNMRP
jgi:hypothetical protein